MVVKRRVTVEDSDDDEDDFLQSTPPTKRARTKEEDEDSQQEESSTPPTDVDVSMDNIDNDAEMEYEEKNEEKIKAILTQQPNIKGTQASSGVLISLQMKHFMCHSNLTLEFNPYVNFITGRNGSGKSALLSALQIGLGARTYLTGRGTSLKALIQDKQPTATIILKMRNAGPEAFRPELYGDVITIIRTINSNGGGVWQLKNKQGKVVGRKKSDLQDLVDHMNIQIDSPLNILTQDAAKQFLAGSSPHDKYAFFLKGTQLAQLTEEYELVQTNIRKIDTSISQRGEVLPGLREAAREAEAKLSEAHKARDQASRLKSLRNELAWSHVASKYSELEKNRDQHEKLEKSLAKLEKKVEEAEADVQAKEAEWRTLTDAVTDDEGSDESKQKELDELKKTISANKIRIHEFHIEIERVNKSLNDVNGLIEILDVKIAAESGKLREEEAEKHERILSQLEETRSMLKAKEEELEGLNVKRRNLQAELESIQQERRGAERDLQETQRKLSENEQYQATLRDAQRDTLNKFGANIALIHQEISNTQWQGSSPPIGPLGMHVSLRDPKYRSVLQVSIGQTMFNWVVSHSADRPRLAAILQRHRNNGQIIIAERDIFDYSRGVPSNQTTVTPLHVLDFTDEWVMRIFINSHGIERTGLAGTRADAQRMAEHDAGRTYWSADGYRILKYNDGGWSSQPFQQMGQADARRNMFGTDGDSNSEVQRVQQIHQELQDKIGTIRNFLTNLKTRHANCQKDFANLQPIGGAASRAVSELKSKKEDLEAMSTAEAPVEVGLLESQRQEHQNEKDAILRQYQIIEQRRVDVSAENKPLVLRQQQLKEELDYAEENRRSRRDEAERKYEEVLAAKKTHKHYDDRRKTSTVSRDAHAEKLAVTENEYEIWTQKAAEISPIQVENPRKVNIVQGEIEALEKALKQRERRHGATVEEMESECRRTKDAVMVAETDVRSMKELYRHLSDALKGRMETWHAFRRSIALRAKIQFQYHLSTRGYTGRLIFDHQAGTLNLRVQTDDRALGATQGRDKDPSSLSGGEKSYSQICLLLALWEGISSPIRCLDEFDVFMDNVNRKICMSLMIEHAKSSNAKQYIFISPLDVKTYVQTGPQVKIQQMPEPQRGGQAAGQTTLEDFADAE